MIRSATLAAAMGLIPLAACQKSADVLSVENKADLLASDLEARADNMDAMADAMANESAASAMRNAAESVEASADNVRDQAHAKVANMH
ncbi:MAG: hypothetical protein M3R64_06810 [Pseudomonadota bacterium]|nr:hypothetical protein [Pseudomonadota bacterium]